MIANFFRILTEQGVEYLLISGQATVLYGAATFSEDVDIWINPTAANTQRFLTALRACGARYYKLTPPVTVAHLLTGHGFHFLLPAADEPAVFLDVMGSPPRVGKFVAAAAAALWIDGPWGRLHVIGLAALIDLKKTQRLEDYPIISKLTLAWLRQSAHPCDNEDFRAALDNIFTLPELRQFFEMRPTAVELSGIPPALRDFGLQLRETGDVTEELLTPVTDLLQQRIAQHQQTDRIYWRPIITELRALRQAGQLQHEGDPV